jgi:hypothetical protein
MADKVSITEAVKYLAERGDAADRSTLSRYVKQHAEALPTERKGKETLVDPEALLRHRQENIRLKVPGPRKAPSSRNEPDTRGATQAHSAARKVTAEAELKEIQLAREKGQLTPTSEVEAAALEAVAQMRSAFDLAVNTAADRLAAKFGGEARLYRPELKAMIRAGLDEFTRKMTELAHATEEGQQPG